MYNSSIKWLLPLATLATLAVMATYSLTHPSMTNAVLVAIVTALSLICLFIAGVMKRHWPTVALVCLSCCYLLVADGGMFPKMERKLPTEWLLSKNTGYHTVFDNGRLRSQSLAKWSWRVCTEKRHKDTEYLTDKPALNVNSTCDINASPLPINLIKLPELVVTPTSGSHTAAKRDDPQNRIFFIVGHCWCVLAFCMLGAIIVLEFKRADPNVFDAMRTIFRHQPKRTPAEFV